MLLLPGLLPADSGLSVEECQKLYAKQLLLATKAGPLKQALELNQSGLVARSTILAEVNTCRNQVSRKMYQCQMAAESFLEILLCEESLGKGRSLQTIVDQFQKRQAASSSNTDGSTDANTGDPSDSVDGQPANPGKEKASAEQCEKAYQNMLGIYSDSKYLKEDPDRKQLLESWKSESARVSFQSRCVQRFSSSDATCLVEARDPAGVQQCLSVIPAG
ncbi:MAG: hypothetical protein CMN77_02980 [Spirochaetaceae bacterium]|nr:hypothetical protein [Spirochaetaceae bacterium]